MKKRNVLKILIIVFYVVLISTFFVFAKIKRSENDKCINSTCVRFCKDDQNKTLINGEITSNDIELTNPLTNLTQKFRILNGEPCEKMKYLDTNQWTFSSVS